MAKKKKTGRPKGSVKHVFKPEYCEIIVNKMREGDSFWATCATEFSCGMSTIKGWLEKYPEFLEAQKRGTYLSLAWWEKVGRAGTVGKIKNFNATAYIYNMKNRFREYGWADKQETEHSGAIDINLKVTDYRAKS